MGKYIKHQQSTYALIMLVIVSYYFRCFINQICRPDIADCSNLDLEATNACRISDAAPKILRCLPRRCTARHSPPTKTPTAHLLLLQIRDWNAWNVVIKQIDRLCDQNRNLKNHLRELPTRLLENPLECSRSGYSSGRAKIPLAMIGQSVVR